MLDEDSNERIMKVDTHLFYRIAAYSSYGASSKVSALQYGVHARPRTHPDELVRAGPSKVLFQGLYDIEYLLRFLCQLILYVW